MTSTCTTNAPTAARYPEIAKARDAARATLVTCGDAGATGHDAASRRAVAHRLAQVMGFEFGGAYEPGTRYAQPLYFVPSDALPAASAKALGIRAAEDLFGGVVPRAFVATKVITHPLHRRDAPAPAGWSHDFARRSQGAVLRGFSAFTREDAQRAANDLLVNGPVRIKLATGIGGSGQYVVETTEQAAAALAGTAARELAQHGLVVEENLRDAVTFSVGRVEVRGVTLAYCGTQCATPNNRGALVYGGSALAVVRGGFARLLEQPLPAAARAAVVLAQRYDDAATRSYPGFFASRRNYDVAHGRDGAGGARIGVLEQSWRIGGASGAEVVALEAFCDDPALEAVHASSVERYGEGVEPPPGAFVYFRGDDAHVGRLIKYACATRA
jgi:hypothetical protein